MPSLFTKILNGEIKGHIVHQDEHCFAIPDIQPQAPIHLLVIPKKEIASISAAEPSDQQVLGHLLLTAKKLAQENGLSEDGYRLVINNGPDAGQSVDHLHIHLIGGRPMSWPPG